MTELAKELARCPLFDQIGERPLRRLAESSRLIKRRKDEIIVHEGSPCEGFFVLTEGLVRVYKLAPDGRERTLHIVRPPHSFAEAALFHTGGYPAFASAMEESRLILVPREPFLQMLENEPESAVRMFESLSVWMHRLLDQLETETFLNARAKLASYILRELRRQPAKTDAARLRLTAAKKEIASQLGMAPETFSRAQADLEARGLILVSGRNIDVPDLSGLEEVVVGDISS